MEAHSVAGVDALPTSCDVAVIGAGLTGLSAALTLSKLGVRVIVLEAHGVGWGASSRNGGMVLSGLKLGPRELVDRFGPQAARDLDSASIAAIDFVERLVREEQIACDFVRCGHLALASKPTHYERLARDAELIARDFGRQVRLVPREELREETGSPSYHGALLDEASAGVHPAKLVHGLAQAARRAGAQICEQTKVVRIQRRANGSSRAFSITTRNAMVNADTVIIATGAYTGSESPWLLRRIVPIGSYVIATEPLSAELAREISPHGRMMYDSKRFLHYFRLTPDCRLLFGGRASFVPESAAACAQSAEILRRDMIEVFPQLRTVGIEYAWGGTLDFTYDMLPHAGTIDGVYYAVGYAGHGVAMALYLGARLAAALAGGVADNNPFMRRFPALRLGMHRFVHALVPAMGAWYRLLDAVS